MTFRGWDDSLRARIARAGNRYADDDSLRSFESFAGAHLRMVPTLDPDVRLVVVVESQRNPYDKYEQDRHPRTYAPVAFLFTGELHRERVDVLWPTPRGAEGFRTARTAERYGREYLRRVTDLIAGTRPTMRSTTLEGAARTVADAMRAELETE